MLERDCYLNGALKFGLKFLVVRLLARGGDMLDKKQTLSQLAQRLYQLEIKHRENGLADGDREHWRSLTILLMNELSVSQDKRNFLRFPTLDAYAQILLKRSRVKCSVTNLSTWGLAVRGKFNGMAMNGPIHIESIHLDGNSAELNINCAVRWEHVDGRDAALTNLGLEIVDTTPLEWEEYFEQVHYPSYMDFLRSLF